MVRKRAYPAIIAAALCLAAAAASPARHNEPRSAAPPIASPARVAALQHDPQFILEAVAKRMGVTLRPDISPPTIRLESRTVLARLQVAAERQWGFRPGVFTTMYATAANEVYLIDDDALYGTYGGTPDDSLAHELVHYIQAHYLGDRFTTDWSETEAIAVQTWFRGEYMESRLAAAKALQPDGKH